MRLIDADKAKLVLDWNLVGDAADAACKVIDDAPAVDAVVVTRCKDCANSYEDAFGRVCAYGICVDRTVPDDFYCAYGKPRDASC